MSNPRTPKKTNLQAMAKRLTLLRRALDECQRSRRKLVEEVTTIDRERDRLFQQVQKLEADDLHRRHMNARVQQAILSYPDRLPQHPTNWGEGNYQYLLDCLRAEMKYWAAMLNPLYLSDTPPSNTGAVTPKK